MIAIDPKLIDIEFGFDGYKGIGEENAFGANEFPTALLYPKSEWKAKIEEIVTFNPFVNSPHPREALVANYCPKDRTTGTDYVYNQSPESSCVLNAACGAIMRRWNMQVGHGKQVILSPMSGYCNATRSRNSGTYMMTALQITSTIGVLPSSGHGQKDKFKHTLHENTPFIQRESLPNGWEETAKLILVLEWLKLNSLEQFGSALLNQFPVVYGRSGHSMVGEDLVWQKNAFYSRTCDSYGYKNRDGTGRIYDSERMMSYSGAWACRVVKMLEFAIAA